MHTIMRPRQHHRPPAGTCRAPTGLKQPVRQGWRRRYGTAIGRVLATALVLLSLLAPAAQAFIVEGDDPPTSPPSPTVTDCLNRVYTRTRTATPQAVLPGTSTTLRWDVAIPSGCAGMTVWLLEPWMIEAGVQYHVGYVSAAGNTTVHPSTTRSTYFLVARMAGAEVSLGGFPLTVLPATGVSFHQPVLTPTETASVLHAFDWRRTTTLSVGPTVRPPLYYMNILIEDVWAPRVLQQMGVQVLELPLFPQEAVGWQASQTLVMHNGVALGRWVFAVVPGAAYDRIREESLAALNAGRDPAFRAVVLRKVPVPAAQEAGHPYRLSYLYLGEQGFAYEAVSNCTIVDGVRLCSIQQEVLGWLARKVFNFVAGELDDVIELIREGFGWITKKIKGEVTLTLTFELLNTDPLFGANLTPPAPMRSGWKNTPLTLAGVRVRARQGLASFSATTDAAGQVTLSVAKNAATTICVDLENDTVKLTGFANADTICPWDLGKLTADRTETLQATHPRLNVLAQITDVAEYLRTVAHYEMPKITVLIGWWANLLAVDDDRAFAPCLGRMPNLTLNTATAGMAVALASIYAPLGIGAEVAAELAEFFLSVDIVLPEVSEASRGVAVHEYSHTVMCALLARHGDGMLQRTWAGVILATLLGQTGEESYMAEAFADFLTAQVVGGTNYFAVSDTRFSLDVDYCNANAGPCLDENYDASDLSDLPSNLDPERIDFLAQVRRVATILHDAFDGHAGADATLPNDGALWVLGFTSAPINHPANTADLRDEAIALEGAHLPTVFARMRQRGDALTEANFLGGLADTMRSHGHSDSDICSLFALHETSRTCPAYIHSATLLPLWSTLGHDAQRTGQSAFAGPAGPVVRAVWSSPSPTGGVHTSAPVVAGDGSIYVGSKDGHLYAFNPDGSQPWAYRTGNEISGTPSLGPDGTIYVGSADRKLYAVAPDGRLKWTFTIGTAVVFAAPAIGADGTVYVASLGGKLYALDPATGAPQWAFTAGGPIRSSPALGADGTIYFGAGYPSAPDGKVYAVAPDGGLKWAVQTTAAHVTSSPTVGPDGRVYVGSGDGRLYALTATGTVAWVFDTGTRRPFWYAGSALALDGTIYIGSTDGFLYAVRGDGMLKWKFLTDEEVLSTPSIGVDGKVYIASAKGRVYGLNPEGPNYNRKIWEYPLGAPITLAASPALGPDGVLYIAAPNGLHALSDH